MFTAETFDLLSAFEKNNRRDWYLAHRTDIDNLLNQPFADTLEAISRRLRRRRIALSGSAASMFRMQRDLRFSRDKSPYNPHVSGVLTSSGTKSTEGPIVYLRLTASGGFAATGFYQPSSARLAEIRESIAEHPEKWGEMTAKLQDAGRWLERDGGLLGMPRGYTQWADSPLAPLLKLKSFIVRESLEPTSWVDETVPERVVQLVADALPLLRIERAD